VLKVEMKFTKVNEFQVLVQITYKELFLIR
jgi:hypothetical protein